MFLNLVLLFLGLLYYLPFINKGLVLYDEGYYVHLADRIFNNQIPYKDFFLQFSPGYFYILAFVFKLFGEKIIVERILTLAICLGILYLNLKITEKLNFNDIKSKTFVFISTVAFGFPLVNNPSMLAWVSVLTSLLIIYSTVFWLETGKNLVLIPICLALQFFFKQNLGIYFLIITNLFVFFNSKNKLKDLLTLNAVFSVLSFSWILYFFHANFDLLKEFIEFNKRYAYIYPLSYPSPALLLNLTGLFKLIPYYLPIVLGILVIGRIKKIKSQLLFIFAIALVGFFGTVVPTSDLLHVYPFYSMVLISGLMIFKGNKLFYLIVIISVASGFYLTFFREYYRYQPQYSLQDTPLNLPRTSGIYIDKPLSENIISLNTFIKNTNSNYVLVYPFSPMLYFILDIKNPSKYSIYYPGYLSNSQEDYVINELKSKKVKYIITSSDYKFNSLLSKFIQKQKEVYRKNNFRVFKII